MKSNSDLGCLAAICFGLGLLGMLFIGNEDMSAGGESFGLVWTFGWWIVAVLLIDIQDRGRAKSEGRERSILRQVTTLDNAYNLSPVEFEHLVKALFEAMGYTAKATAATGDEGIDLYLTRAGRKELVQCKRYKGNVSVQHVREFYGVMVDKRVTRGYVVTTGHFTLPARQFAEGKGIHLIDGPELAEMLENAGLGNVGDPSSSDS